MSDVQNFLDRQDDLDLSVHYVWLPMFPRVAEARALPNVAAHFADKGLTQYWDDSKAIGIELKQRIIPQFKGDVVWDTFLLFGPDATWADAEDHLLEWGYTVVEKQETLFARLTELAASTTPEAAGAADAAE